MGAMRAAAMAALLMTIPMGSQALPGPGRLPPGSSVVEAFFWTSKPAQERFADELKAFQDTLRMLGDTLAQRQDELEAIKSYSLDAAKKEAEAITSQIQSQADRLARKGPLLGAVDDVLKWADEHRTRVGANDALDAARRRQLEAEWDAVIAEMNTQRKELNLVAAQLHTTLARARSDSAMITELLLLRKAHDALATIRQLVHDLRNANNELLERANAIRLPAGPAS